MQEFDIIRNEQYLEVRISDRLDLDVIRGVLAEANRAAEDRQRSMLWSFGPKVRPLAFHEFEDVIAVAEKYLARRPAGKRLALAVPGPFARSIAEVFVGLAWRLPVRLQVFEDLGAARAWLES